MACLVAMESRSKAREHGKARSQIRFRTTMHGTVVLQVMLWRGWTEVEEEYDWDIFWCGHLQLLDLFTELHHYQPHDAFTCDIPP